MHSTSSEPVGRHYKLGDTPPNPSPEGGVRGERGLGDRGFLMMFQALPVTAGGANVIEFWGVSLFMASALQS